MTQIVRNAAKRSSAMMDALGIDLETWVMRDAVGPDIDDEVASRCAACHQIEDCESWIAGTDAAINAPDYCRNRALFDQLTA